MFCFRHCIVDIATRCATYCEPIGHFVIANSRPRQLGISGHKAAQGRADDGCSGTCASEADVLPRVDRSEEGVRV